MNISDISGKVKIVVKPNSKKDEIVWDESRQAWKVAIAAPAQQNKANIAVIKFFSRLTKKQVRILSGFASKEKVLFIH